MTKIQHERSDASIRKMLADLANEPGQFVAFANGHWNPKLCLRPKVASNESLNFRHKLGGNHHERSVFCRNGIVDFPGRLLFRLPIVKLGKFADLFFSPTLW